MGGTGAGRGAGRRYTQREAAEALGVSVEAVRKRVKRGTLASEKGADGRRYVYLDAAPDASDPQAEGEGFSSPLVAEMRDRIESLESQLREERRANDENRRLLAAALERIPAIEAPASPGSPTASESPQEGHQEEGSEGSGPGEESERLRTAPERAPWWRRWLRPE
jgi:hypothetical protein